MPSNNTPAISSPRTRRYFQVSAVSWVLINLFSAHAEVFPRWKISGWACSTLLRARGGISSMAVNINNAFVSSPRTRRYFQHGCKHQQCIRLFSAHAEVFPAAIASVACCWALLRARGGISLSRSSSSYSSFSSPRTRRYFQSRPKPNPCRCLFSAHAEVFPA